MSLEVSLIPPATVQSISNHCCINVNVILCIDRNLGKSGLRVSCLGLGKSLLKHIGRFAALVFQRDKQVLLHRPVQEVSRAQAVFSNILIQFI